MQNTRPAAVAIEVVCGRLFTLSRTSPSDAETVFISIEEFQESRPLFASVTVFLNVPLLAESRHSVGRDNARSGYFVVVAVGAPRVPTGLNPVMSRTPLFALR